MARYTALPVCLPYHPASELNNRPGYYPNITPEQLEAASSLSALIEQANLRFNYGREDEFLKLLRFLRARKFNVQLAFKMIQEDVKWRSEGNRLNLQLESADEVLDCDLEKMYKYFPTWIQGVDKQLRPVSYRQFGKFEVWNVLKLTTMERLLRFHAWETEQALRYMYQQSAKTKYNIETFVIVIDAAGWGISLATRDAFTFIQGMAKTDSDHYPERLGTLIVINAPFGLAAAWKIVQGFLDDVTKAKVRILGGNRNEWLPVLLEHIDQSEIPQQYGGFAPDPTPEEAIRNMNPHCDEDESYGGEYKASDSPSSSTRSRTMCEQGTQTDDPFQRAREELSRSEKVNCTVS